MVDVVSFGEAMIRLSSPSHYRLEQTSVLEVSVGGAELSVAAGVSRMGLQSAWVSRVPDNAFGRMIANKGREFGIDMSHLVWAPGERAGLYFIEYGADPRPTRVIYDRQDSALARIKPSDVDWNTVLQDARLFHVGGITPALSATAAETQRRAMAAAKDAGCLVSYDLNYRANLWSVEEARQAQLPLMEYVDILTTSFPDEPNVNELLSGLGGDPGNVAESLAEEFGLKAVLVTMRGSPSTLWTTWTSLAWVDGAIVSDRRYKIKNVDRLGGGDACVAGFITGYLEGDAAYGLRLGNALSALTQTSPTDWPWPTRREAEVLMQDNEKRLDR